MIHQKQSARGLVRRWRLLRYVYFPSQAEHRCAHSPILPLPSYWPTALHKCPLVQYCKCSRPDSPPPAPRPVTCSGLRRRTRAGCSGPRLSPRGLSARPVVSRLGRQTACRRVRLYRGRRASGTAFCWGCGVPLITDRLHHCTSWALRAPCDRYYIWYRTEPAAQCTARASSAGTRVVLTASLILCVVYTNRRRWQTTYFGI